MKKNLQIAIDGPVAAGKGTVAAKIAQILGIVYVDTGAMYRAVALLGIQENIDLKNETELLDLVKESNIEFKVEKNNHRSSKIFLNDKDISDKIRTQEISQGASIVAALPKIRKFLVEKQQEIAKKQSVVMEGRDITTRVLPYADLKIFLTADQKERARRRQKQLKERGVKVNFQKMLAETKERDTRDSERKADPLTKASDAKVLDTTDLSIKEVVERILLMLRKTLNYEQEN